MAYALWRQASDAVSSPLRANSLALLSRASARCFSFAGVSLLGVFSVSRYGQSRQTISVTEAGQSYHLRGGSPNDRADKRSVRAPDSSILTSTVNSPSKR